MLPFVRASPFVTRALVALAAASPALAGCAAAPEPASPKIVVVPAEPGPPPLPPARWVTSRGVTKLGNETSAGTFVVLGGRRGLLSADGKLSVEAAPLAEPIAELVEVPTAQGSRFFSASPSRVLRFDDPLGPPTVVAQTDPPPGSDVVRLELGSFPDRLAVWHPSSRAPRFLDVASGKLVPAEGLLQTMRPTRAAFLDARRGAAIFRAIGLAVSSDGGKTFQPVASPSPGLGTQVSYLRRRGGKLFASEREGGPEGEISFDPPRLAALADPPATEPSLLRFLRTARMDPLRAAATSGLEIAPGQALAMAGCTLALIDLQTGGVLDLNEIVKGRTGGCSLARSGSTLWASRSPPSGSGSEVMKVELGPKGITLGEATQATTYSTDRLLGSPSGGLAFNRGCATYQGLCVRQPDGKWKSMASTGGRYFDSSSSAAGPLSDGRVAFFRRAQESGGKGPDESAGARFEIVTLDTTGKETVRATFSIPTPMARYRSAQVHSPIEEDEAKNLRFSFGDGERVYTVLVPPGHEAVQLREVPGAQVALLKGLRGIAAGQGVLQATSDGGASWEEIAAPPSAADRAGASGRSVYRGLFEVSEVGLQMGNDLRIGWGQGELPKLPSPDDLPERGPLLDGPAREHGVGPRLSCTSRGLAPSVPSVLLAEDLNHQSDPFGKEPESVKRRGRHFGGYYSSMLAVSGWFEEQGPKDAPDAARWRFKWQDAKELGARLRTLSIPAPKGNKWNASVDYTYAYDGRALFGVRLSNQWTFLRVDGRGAADTAELPTDLGFPDRVAFGEADSVAFSMRGKIFLWRKGEPPVLVAELAPGSVAWTGAPTKDAVPLVLYGDELSLYRELPIPPKVDKGAKPVRPPPLGLDGWKALPAFNAHMDKLPVCAPGKRTGVRFVVNEAWNSVVVDGVEQRSNDAGNVTNEVWLTGSELCLARVSALFPIDPSALPTLASPSLAPALRPSPGPTGAVHLLRADLVDKKAEANGPEAKSEVRKLECTVAKPASP